MNSSLVKYVTCCKLWMQFHTTSSASLLLRYKLTDPVYYELLCDFNMISIVFNSLNKKEVLNESDIQLIERELSRFTYFFNVINCISDFLNEQNV